MRSQQLVWSPVLNFLYRARAVGNVHADIAKTGPDFFSTDSLMEAKKILWNFANCTNRPSDRQKAADNFLDMLIIFEKCDEKQIPLPRFVLYEPDEVPVIAGESSATLTRKVNELCVKFDNYVLSKRNPLPSLSQAPTQSSKPSFAVILKNPPKMLNDPKD